MASDFKSFSRTTTEDYQQLGLKAGLEIHQQILTEKKLFCHCPAGRYSSKYDAEILRHMRPTLSELGEYDGTALMEFKTKKEIIYQINHETVCTYEMDDTPPFEINQNALNIALETALLLNFQMASEIHISRKQYLDGSIPTGFQRTTIVGIDGWIPYKNRKIGLIQLGLEEDACREVSDIGHTRTFLTDRLGMPLIEMVTYPHMVTPQEVADVANILRWATRSTGNMRTGIGAARQDVNVSISGGTRVEIKGVPRIPMIPLLIHNEAYRQHALLEIKKELTRRGIDGKKLDATSQDVTGLMRNTKWDPLVQSLKKGDRIFCVNLRGFHKIMSYPTQPNKVFSNEISDRVRVIACLTQLPNILTSETTAETIENQTWGKIQKNMGAGPNDALILVWGNTIDVQTAVQEIIIRAGEAAQGIPNETRQAFTDGTNGFERILPGPDRMYPDTDLPPLAIGTDLIKKIKKTISGKFWGRGEKYQKWGLPHHLIHIISSSPLAVFFETLIEKYSIPPKRAANFLFEKTKAWERQGLPVEKLNKRIWTVFFESTAKQPALFEKGEELFKTYLQNPKMNIIKCFEEFSSKKMHLSELKKIIKRVLKKESSLFESEENKHRYLMRQVMEPSRGLIPAIETSKALLDAMHSNGEKDE